MNNQPNVTPKKQKNLWFNVVGVLIVVGLLLDVRFNFLIVGSGTVSLLLLVSIILQIIGYKKSFGKVGRIISLIFIVGTIVLLIFLWLAAINAD